MREVSLTFASTVWEAMCIVRCVSGNRSPKAPVYDAREAPTLTGKQPKFETPTESPPPPSGLRNSQPDDVEISDKPEDNHSTLRENDTIPAPPNLDLEE